MQPFASLHPKNSVWPADEMPATDDGVNSKWLVLTCFNYILFEQNKITNDFDDGK